MKIHLFIYLFLPFNLFFLIGWRRREKGGRMYVWEERDVSIVHYFSSWSSAELKAKNPTYCPDSVLEPQFTFIQYHRQETEAEDEQPGLRANWNPDRSSIHPSPQVSQSLVFKIPFVNLKNRERENFYDLSPFPNACKSYSWVNSGSRNSTWISHVGVRSSAEKLGGKLEPETGYFSMGHMCCEWHLNYFFLNSFPKTSSLNIIKKNKCLKMIYLIIFMILWKYTEDKHVLYFY